MEKVKVTISYNSNESISMVFFVDNAKNAKTFFEVLSKEEFQIKKIETKNEKIEQNEKERMNDLVNYKN